MGLDKEDAFLVGLLHDIGKVVVLRCCGEVYQKTNHHISDELFEYLCQEYHELMGEMIAGQWQLPAHVASAIARHHSTESFDDADGRQRALVQITDATLSLLGHTTKYPYDLLSIPAARYLKVGENARFLETLPLIPDVIELSLEDE
jgi:HD-like signal output (HDOD) protein